MGNPWSWLPLRKIWAWSCRAASNSTQKMKRNPPNKSTAKIPGRLAPGMRMENRGVFSASLTPEPRQIYQNLASNLDNFKSCWILTDHPQKDQGLVPLIILQNHPNYFCLTSKDWTLIVYWPLRVWFPMKLKVLGVWGNKTVAIIMPTSIWTRFRLSIP